MREYPYWWDTAPAFQSESQTVRSGLEIKPYDVAIVGAGYTGLSAARHLARAGAAVIVFERGQVGVGASSRNAGQVLTGLRLDPADLVGRYGESGARALFDVSRAAIARLEALLAEEALECQYERVGHIQAAWKPAHFAAFRDEQSLLARVFHHQVHLVSEKDQESELGSRRYHGLLVDERSAALNPAQYVRGLADAARRAGATIATGHAVSRLERRGRRWTVWTEDTPVEVGDVLIATNGYTSAISPGLQRRLVPVGSYIVVTELLRADIAAQLLPRRRVAFDSKHFLFYFRLTSDGRLLFGGRAEFGVPSPDAVKRAAAILRRGMVHVFPELAGVGIEFAWGGTAAFTWGEMPHAGRLDDLYYAGGYCGHGIAMATYLGELIARRLAGEIITNPLLDTPFRPIPFYSGRPWFLPLVGAYYRIKDWIQ